LIVGFLTYVLQFTITKPVFDIFLQTRILNVQ